MSNKQRITSANMVLAGSGGQGIQFASKLLATAGMKNGRQVTWLPSYGAEMRGGTSNCSVVISEDFIGSPHVVKPNILIVMNLPSYLKFIEKAEPGGAVFIDSSLIGVKCERGDLDAHYVPATRIAYENDLKGLANVIMIGRAIAVTGIFTPEEIEAAFPSAKAELFEANKRALAIGYGYSGE